MKILLIGMTCAILLVPLSSEAASVACPVDSDATGAASATAVVDAFAQAQTRFDQAALQHLLAPGYIEISPLGQVDARQQVIAFYGKQAAEQDKTAGATRTVLLSEANPDVCGDTASIVAREDVFFHVNDEQRTVSFRVMFLLQKTGSAWQITRTQYTPIRQPTTKPIRGARS